MLGIDQIEDYYNELEQLNNKIAKEKDQELQNELRDRRREIVHILELDKEDRRFYFNS
jgi:flagellar hook-associated protein FlgK